MTATALNPNQLGSSIQLNSSQIGSQAQPHSKEVEIRRGNDYTIFNIVRNICYIPRKLVAWNSSYASGNVSINVATKTANFFEGSWT